MHPAQSIGQFIGLFFALFCGGIAAVFFSLVAMIIRDIWNGRG